MSIPTGSAIGIKQEQVGFRTVPRIVRAGARSTVTITPRFDHVAFSEQTEYQVLVTPMENRGCGPDFGGPGLPQWSLQDGSIEIHADFPSEQEYSIVIQEIQPKAPRTIGDFRVYALEEDLHSLRPWKGDFHMHSNRSDGRESPAYVAASCRRIGLDFMAITDHGQYGPSLEAQAAFTDLPVDLRIFAGEEVHPPENPIHIINFGGAESVNAMFEFPGYREEVDEIIARSGNLPSELNPYYYGSSLWCFRKIREIGGLSIFCHPYWVFHHRYHIPASLADRMFADRPFDAYELIGGYFPQEAESNALQVLRYSEERARGNNFPVVGVSDAHGCDRGELFGWYYSIVFAQTADLDDLIAAVRQGRSVAVEHLPGSSPRAHGPMREARYAHFLLREVLPEHDAVCRPEGEAMVAFLAGDERARRALADATGSVGNYYDDCFGT